MSHFIVNNIKFDKRYVYFERPPWKNYLIPSRECFVHAWQRSDDLPQFHKNVKGLYKLWLSDNPEEKGLELLLTTEMVNYRLGNWPSKGVKLKDLPITSKPDEWEVLASIAESSINME